MSSFTGTSGNDSFTGTSGTDTFDMHQGGNDTVKGNAGDDTFNFGGALTAADTISGGADFDTLNLDGDYSAGLTLSGTTVKGVEKIQFADGHDYKLITADGNAAAGTVMLIWGFGLSAGHTLYVDASAETDAILNIGGGAGDDTLIGGQAGNAIQTSGSGGHDTMIGGAGSDQFYFTSDFDAGDHVDGNAGAVNTVFLSGDYSGGLTLGANTIANIQSINLNPLGAGYTLTLNDGNTAAGATLIIVGENLTAGHVLVLDGSAETDGNLTLLGGAAKDRLTAGAGADQLQGNGGADKLKGGAGADTFGWVAAADSTGSAHDTITKFDAAADKLDLWFTVTGINAAIAAGTLSRATFDSNLSAAVDSGHLGAHHAVLFTPGTGDQAGKTFLVVDANGTAGYQAGVDLVVDVTNMSHAGSFATSDFV
jgi:Ca2+-binding RTX toxin-like protein